MANIKFYRKGRYIIIEDSADSKYYEEHAEKVYVKKATLAATDYYITIGEKRWLAQPIAEIQDESGLFTHKLNLKLFILLLLLQGQLFQGFL